MKTGRTCAVRPYPFPRSRTRDRRSAASAIRNAIGCRNRAFGALRRLVTSELSRLASYLAGMARRGLSADEPCRSRATDRASICAVMPSSRGHRRGMLQTVPDPRWPVAHHSTGTPPRTVLSPGVPADLLWGEVILVGAQASSLPAGGGDAALLVAVGDRPQRLGRQRLASLVAVAPLDGIGRPPRSGARISPALGLPPGPSGGALPYGSRSVTARSATAVSGLPILSR